MKSTGKKPISLSASIAIGLVLGIASGIIFGEYTAPLSYAGNAFVGLLQMTVLPYIMLALIAGIGSLSLGQSRLLLVRVVPIILLMWGLGYLAVFIFGMSLPTQTSASFFSSSLIEEPRAFDFFSLFIPSNPFSSMAENKVPAVVLFSALCGVAIMGLSEKSKIVNGLATAQEILGRVTGYIVRLSPYGVFCIAASAAGTMDLEDIARLQGYMVLMTLLTLCICFLLIPALITSLTPFTSREISPLLRTAFILAFAAGKTMIVLPILIVGIRQIFEDKGRTDDETRVNIEVLAPLAYSFPHLGRILATAFIPFGGWYIGHPLALKAYPLLFGASSFAHFSSAPVSIPFLLDITRLPSDLFELFLVTGVYMARLTDAAGAAYIFAVTLLGTCAANGMLKFRWQRILPTVGGIVLVSMALVLGGRFYLNLTAATEYNKDKVVASMHLPRQTADITVVEPGPNPVALKPGQSHLKRILERGVIRVGFDPDNLPFSHFNKAGEPSGHDIEMMSNLALDLDVSIELIPIKSRGAVHEEMRLDYYDVAVGGFINTVALSQRLNFSDPYMYLNMALVVPDYRDQDFADMATINALPDLHIAVIGDSEVHRDAHMLFPSAQIVVVNSPSDFFKDHSGKQVADVLLMSAEAGSSWTLLYPRYQVSLPLPHPVKLPAVILYSGSADSTMDEFLDNWVMLKRSDGSLNNIYDYWILGKGTESYEPRWSVIRNVLGWVQ
ncbi:MAG: cation:dicarboxylase symporter family transporter [Halioglobus sp.]